MRTATATCGLLTASGFLLAVLVLSPTTADANSRRHVFKPDLDNAVEHGAVPAGVVTKDAGAPEIDPSTFGASIALAAGGLAILSARRRSPRP